MINYCELCPNLIHRRSCIVKPRGSKKAKILFLGMNPDKEENRLGECFLGQSGTILSHIIQWLGLHKHEYFLTNAIRCYGAKNNTKEEINNCLVNLLYEINIIRPKIIIVLGDQAMNALNVLIKNSVKYARGIINDVEIKMIIGYTVKLMPVYHPQFIIKSGGEASKIADNQAEYFLNEKETIEGVLGRKLLYS